MKIQETVIKNINEGVTMPLPDHKLIDVVEHAVKQLGLKCEIKAVESDIIECMATMNETSLQKSFKGVPAILVYNGDAYGYLEQIIVDKNALTGDCNFGELFKARQLLMAEYLISTATTDSIDTEEDDSDEVAADRLLAQHMKEWMDEDMECLKYD